MKPTFDDNGKIIFEDFGDSFCKVKKGNERYIPGKYTHKAILEMNGAEPGYLLITPQHDYIITAIDRKNNVVGLIVKK
jgi:hypothetical protein